MNKTFLRSIAVGAGLFVLVVGPAAGKESKTARTVDPARMVLRYAEALVTSRVTEWAALDLGCLTLRRQQGASAETDRACWDGTMKAHRVLVADEPEKGIFGAVGRGLGFGLISETHRQADTWKDSPPGVFLSPAVTTDTVPRVTVKKVWPVRSIAIQEKGKDPVAVGGTMVEVLVTYPDPLTAPLALKPNEVWWANGQIRRYAPVRELAVQFVVVSGLRKLGYSSDTAVVNEALTDAPQIPGTRYGFNPENIGRAFDRPDDPSAAPSARGGLVLGSARWWTKQEAAERFRAGVERAKHLSIQPERQALLRRLLLLDPNDAETNALLGGDLFHAFLGEGLSKSGIHAQDEEVRLRLAELYWNLQAPTWRQELVEVAVGHSTAAEALYGAIQALELAQRGRTEDRELRRRLGALYRWSNDADAALVAHEGLLAQLPPTEVRQRGSLLGELAWDRIQWIAWNRRYDHPWLPQAGQEAAEALSLGESPVEKLIAGQALLMAEALSASRDPARLQEALRRVRQWHDQVAGVAGLWDYLAGNDLVRPLLAAETPAGTPTVTRAPDVLDVGIHSQPPPQDLLRAWEFDDQRPGEAPREFSPAATAKSTAGHWRIEADQEAPTAPNVLAHTSACAAPDCLQLLLADVATFQYPDVMVRLRLVSGGTHAGAGLALATQDGRGLYAVTFAPATNTVAIHRVRNGQAVQIGSAPVKPAKGAWHLLRVQYSNFLNVSLPRLAIFFDGSEVSAVTDDVIGQVDRVGLVTRGDAVAKFDGLHLLDLVSNRPLSKPAAY
jgi:hypothetical protein